MNLAIHLHLYYGEQWDEIKNYLLNIKFSYDLYITLPEDNFALIRKIKSFHKETKIFVIENRGYDVGAFIFFLHRINLSDYDLILKLHTKGKNGCDWRIGYYTVSRKYWNKLLFEGLLGSEKLFAKNMQNFEKFPKLGMIGSKYLITSAFRNYKPVAHDVHKMMKELINVYPARIKFVAGTMFMVRSSLLQKIKDNFSFEDFEQTDKNTKDGTLAHILERAFGSLVVESGYEIKGFDTNAGFVLSRLVLPLRNFLFSKTLKRNLLKIKICKIPVYWQKISRNKICILSGKSSKQFDESK
ncbi:MAG: hypothetical protein IJW72_04220 [Alphaproteobacteria bacterium]|nr:hypothetical protein [Alphaproteobacteria bacterium]